MGSKSLDAPSKGRTPRAQVAWLVPMALASTLLLGAVAVASNYQTFTASGAFNSFVQGPKFTESFTGANQSAAFFDFSGSGFSYRVSALTPTNTQVNVSLVNNPVSAITPSSISPGNQLFFTRNLSSAPISAFGGFFSLGNWDADGSRTAGTMTLTAFNGASQVASGSFSVGPSGPSFFGISGIDDSFAITEVRLTGVATDPTFQSVNAEVMTVGTIAPVPEPSTLALGGCALVAIVLARRMKPRKARAVIGVSIAILAMHVTSTMADSTVVSRPPDTAVVQGVDGRPAAPPMEPLVPSVASSL